MLKTCFDLQNPFCHILARPEIFHDIIEKFHTTQSSWIKFSVWKPGCCPENAEIALANYRSTEVINGLTGCFHLKPNLIGFNRIVFSIFGFENSKPWKNADLLQLKKIERITSFFTEDKRSVRQPHNKINELENRKNIVAKWLLTTIRNDKHGYRKTIKY